MEWLSTRSAALLKEPASGFGNMLCQSIQVQKETGGRAERKQPCWARPEDDEGEDEPYLPLRVLLLETPPLGSVLF